jgi:hypothetical protein
MTSNVTSEVYGLTYVIPSNAEKDASDGELDGTTEYITL